MKWMTLLYKKIRFGGAKYRCIVCGNGVRLFFPFSTNLVKAAMENGFPYDFRRMETLNYDNCNCPFCLSSDRERLYLIFLEQHFEQGKKTKYSILDFAPTESFARYLRNRKGVSYTSADLFRGDVDMKIDLCDMKEIQDRTYDIIICSHVLEHVPDPEKAISELKRVLADDGLAVIMVPVFIDVKEKIENKQHTSANDRLKFYGQEDHVRLYSRESYLNELKENGFRVEIMHVDQFDAEQIRKNAIDSNSALYVCTKD